MKTKIRLVVPKKGSCIKEMASFLSAGNSGITIFPEGFLESASLEQALDLTRKTHSFVIAGLKTVEPINQQKAVILDDGKLVGEYTKCILTQGEKEKGRVPGEKISCVETRFGRIGIPICYELHFPEVVRAMALERPVLMVNPIGTGMYHDLQYEQWTALAKARAIENEVFVVGCCHFTGEIPLAFAYGPSGRCILEKKREYGAFDIAVDLTDSGRKRIGYLKDRVPGVFDGLCR